MSANRQQSAGEGRSLLGLLASPFWSKDEGRLRWGWRSIVPMVASIFILIASFVASAPIVPLVEPLLAAGDFPRLGEFVLGVGLRVLAVLVILVVWARFVDRRRIADYGFHLGRAWWADLAGGMLFGVFISTAAFVALLALGWASVSDVASPSASFVVAFVVLFFTTFGIGFWEETLFRGIALKNAAEGFRSTRFGIGARGAVLLAWVLSSLGFTLYHVVLGGGLASFGYYMVSSLAIGLVYVLTGELGFAIGFHAMYDFFHGVVFVPDPAPGLPALLGLEIAGSAPQAFVGPAGLLETPIIAFSMLLMLAWVRWRRGGLSLRTALTEWEPRGDGRVR